MKVVTIRMVKHSPHPPSYLQPIVITLQPIVITFITINTSPPYDLTFPGNQFPNKLHQNFLSQVELSHKLFMLTYSSCLEIISSCHIIWSLIKLKSKTIPSLFKIKPQQQP